MARGAALEAIRGNDLANILCYPNGNCIGDVVEGGLKSFRSERAASRAGRAGARPGLRKMTLRRPANQLRHLELHTPPPDCPLNLLFVHELIQSTP